MLDTGHECIRTIGVRIANVSGIETDMNFILPDGTQVEISPDVFQHFAAHVQHRTCDKKAGGQLFARMEKNKWSIALATGPRKTDWGSRFGFRPDRGAERAEIKKLFASDLHCVGDWHTHLESVPTLSNSDIKSINEMVQHSVHTLSGFIMIIVGRDEFPKGLWISFHSVSGQATQLIDITSSK